MMISPLLEDLQTTGLRSPAAVAAELGGRRNLPVAAAS